MSDQMMTRFEIATKPFQFALSTRAGCESIAHIVQSATDNDTRAIVLSIDGVGAFDLISRRAMMTALHRMPDGDSILPFVLQFNGHFGSRLFKLLSAHAREEGFVVCQAFSVQSRSVMPNSRRWQQSGNRRGWTTHEDIQHQAWLRVLQGRRPPSVQWP